MKRQGFTLIELSVVMVIIGLIIGGILVARDIIRNSEIQSMQTQVTSVETAVYAFKLKYGSLPGDAGGAGNFWAGANNGDGNGQIGYDQGAMGEEYYVWEHLSLSGLIAGEYDAATTADLPAAKIDQGFYRLSYQTAYQISSHMISLNRWNDATSLANKAILKPKETYSIDLKYDNGLADSGKILGFNEEDVGGCVDNDHTDTSGTYLYDGDEIVCKLYFVLGN